MTLGELENYALFELQQPGSNFDNGVPDWSRLTNPQFNKSVLDFFLNQGYRQLLADTADFALYLVTQSFPSRAQTYTYTLPDATDPLVTYPQMSKLHRVFYAPKGQNYTREYQSGLRFISWSKFQREFTGYGYLQRFAWGTQPQACALYPDRKTLYLYPGSAIEGDTLTILYTPVPTATKTGTTAVVPTLVNASDEPVTPEDTHEAIAQWALSKLWLRGREKQQADDTRFQYYQNEIAKIRQNHLLVTQADTFGFVPFQPQLLGSDW